MKVVYCTTKALTGILKTPLTEFSAVSYTHLKIGCKSTVHFAPFYWKIPNDSVLWGEVCAIVISPEIAIAENSS